MTGVHAAGFPAAVFLCNRRLRSYYINPHREDAHLRLDVNYLHRIDGFLHQRIDLLGKLSLIIVNHGFVTGCFATKIVQQSS